jgi:hypothetical protein
VEFAIWSIVRFAAIVKNSGKLQENYISIKAPAAVCNHSTSTSHYTVNIFCHIMSFLKAKNPKLQSQYHQVTVQVGSRVTFLCHIQEGAGLNSSHNTNYSDIRHTLCFSTFIPGKYHNTPLIRTLLLPSTSLPVHCISSSYHVSHCQHH